MCVIRALLSRTGRRFEHIPLQEADSTGRAPFEVADDIARTRITAARARSTESQFWDKEVSGLASSLGHVCDRPPLGVAHLR